MKLHLALAARTLTVDGAHTMPAWSEVRNEANKLRPRAGSPDLCYSILRDGSMGPPTMPRTFPLGVWRVTGIIPHQRINEHGLPAEPYLYPFFIATDAWQWVDEWGLDTQGYYVEPTGRRVADSAYGLHYSSSHTTTGCARIGLEEDLRWLVAQIRPRLADGEPITLDVVA